MEQDRQYYHLLDRLQKAAEHESTAIVKALPDGFQDRVKGLAFRFDDRPSEAMVRGGISLEQLSFADGEAGVIHIFLMNVHDRHGKIPGDFRHEVRRLIMQELADWMGVDMELED